MALDLQQIRSFGSRGSGLQQSALLSELFVAHGRVSARTLRQFVAEFSEDSSVTVLEFPRISSDSVSLSC